ncbi:hypothetical protein [Alienimonas californiensis]|uniref:Uncharacterized protein n=1 Tax=Alienimonas californiensis TaxID=2527989 RepID=A0A517P3W9_9PLAN|nr:hypothetical protein [Alienimonas californiensis]QDT14071.1 hypothetical protein CA12_01390 [Alienimonas californiensis]
MSYPNLTAATQGCGFGEPAPQSGRMTRLCRDTLTLLVLAAASLGSVGCHSVPLADLDGSTARLVAAVDARCSEVDQPYQYEAAERENLVLANAR